MAAVVTHEDRVDLLYHCTAEMKARSSGSNSISTELLLPRASAKKKEVKNRK